jgi:hypothetical protein
MTYNIKTLSIYMGLAVIVLGFLNVGLVYLFCKLRNDIKSKCKRLVDESDGEFGQITGKAE